MICWQGPSGIEAEAQLNASRIRLLRSQKKASHGNCRKCDDARPPAGDRGERAAARDALSGVYGWGPPKGIQETKDLRAAKALLDGLPN